MYKELFILFLLQISNNKKNINEIKKVDTGKGF